MRSAALAATVSVLENHGWVLLVVRVHHRRRRLVPVPMVLDPLVPELHGTFVRIKYLMSAKAHSSAGRVLLDEPVLRATFACPGFGLSLLGPSRKLPLLIGISSLISFAALPAAALAFG